MKTKYLIILSLIFSLLCSSPAYAQNTLEKRSKSTQKQTVPAPKQNATTGKSNNKNTTTKNNSNSSTSRNTQTSSSSSQQSQTNNSSSQTQTSNPTGYINSQGYVDLGLSVKWATCNVGAKSPSDYGDYFAWGETKTKSSYTSDNSLTYGKNMGSIAGSSQYDAARANWGGTWRLPTRAEIDELVGECKREWTTQGGHYGYKITGPNGNSIFLPAAGWRYGTSLTYAGEGGYYWSATPNEDNTNYAYYLYFHNSYFGRYWYHRNDGQSVRPVSE